MRIAAAHCWAKSMRPAPLTTGSSAGYEVVEIAGMGGMGQVYRAKDTRLKRDVAIKTLPIEFSHDAERLERFEREATVLASLNHPNIAAIHDVIEGSGAPLLVLEFVDGITLAEALQDGPLSLDKTLRCAHEIALALENRACERHRSSGSEAGQHQDHIEKSKTLCNPS